MKLIFFLLQLTVVFAGLLQRNTPGCDSDNCARAVTGTRLGAAAVTAHKSDCSSFMATTTYFGANRVAQPTATPAYASACSGAGDSYASACSCWGITSHTVTIYPGDDNFQDDAHFRK